MLIPTPWSGDDHIERPIFREPLRWVDCNQISATAGPSPLANRAAAALLGAHPFLSHPADTLENMEAHHIGPLSSASSCSSPRSPTSSGQCRRLPIRSSWIDRIGYVGRYCGGRENSMTVDSWFWFGTTWAVLNVAVYLLFTAAF